MGEKQKNKVKVSDLFVDIYKNFNVCDQIKKMKELDKQELYLLLILCLDKHKDDDHVILNNFKEFKEEVMEIYDLQDDKEVDNEFLKNLVDLTGDKYIDTGVIVDQNDQDLGEPLTREEVRDAKINNIINSDK
jgi:hypothetical protein